MRFGSGYFLSVFILILFTGWRRTESVTIVPSSVRVRSLPDDGEWLIAVTRDVDPYPWWTWRTGGVGRGRGAT